MLNVEFNKYTHFLGILKKELKTFNDIINILPCKLFKYYKEDLMKKCRDISKTYRRFKNMTGLICTMH